MTTAEAQFNYLIPGQMWPVELQWLSQAFVSSRSHCEIGTFAGRSLFASSMGMPSGCEVLSIDSNESRWVQSVRTATINEIETQTGVTVQSMQMTSLEAFFEVSKTGRKFDSVFIDASHEYADVAADIEMWRTLLNSGGTICGHDYWPVHPGVMRAVQEQFNGRFKVIEHTRIWVVK